MTISWETDFTARRTLVQSERFGLSSLFSIIYDHAPTMISWDHSSNKILNTFGLETREEDIQYLTELILEYFNKGLDKS